MKCNIRKDVTSNALYESDLECIYEGLDLLEADIKGFIERGDFSKISLENANLNLSEIKVCREQLDQDEQSLTKNQLKEIYIGLNFLKGDLDAPAEKRSEKNRSLNNQQLMKKMSDVRAAHQKITAVFTRMGVDIMATLRGF